MSYIDTRDIDEAAAHGLSTAGHAPCARPPAMLVRAICARSRSKDWTKACREWRLVLVYILPYGTCVCGQCPIHERCQIRNIHNRHTMVVGNICVHRFLGLETEPIFAGIRRVAKDHEKSFGRAAVEHFLECGWMGDWEYRFYQNTMRRRYLSVKQLEKRIQINEKMLFQIHFRGLEKD